MSNKEALKELLEEVKSRLPSFENIPVPADLDKQAVAVIRLTSGEHAGASIMLQSIVFDGDDMMNVDYSAVEKDGSKIPDPVAQPIVSDLVNFFLANAALADAGLTEE